MELVFIFSLDPSTFLCFISKKIYFVCWIIYFVCMMKQALQRFLFETPDLSTLEKTKALTNPCAWTTNTPYWCWRHFFSRPMSPSSEPHGGLSKIRSSNNVFTHENSGKYNKHGDPILEILGVSYGDGMVS